LVLVLPRQNCRDRLNCVADRCRTSLLEKTQLRTAVREALDALGILARLAVLYSRGRLLSVAWSSLSRFRRSHFGKPWYGERRIHRRIETGHPPAASTGRRWGCRRRVLN